MNTEINIPEDKKKRIIDAGMEIFSRHGYKKAAVDEIVKDAGISKGLVFHYFGSKKGLFEYLFEYAGGFVFDEIMKNMNFDEPDIFKKMQQAVTIKISVMQKHPYLMEFLAKAFYEKDPEIAGIKDKVTGDKRLNLMEFLTRTDPVRFRDGLDPQRVVKIIIWTSYGYSQDLKLEPGFSMEELQKDFDQYLLLMKKAFYKDEYQ